MQNHQLEPIVLNGIYPDLGILAVLVIDLDIEWEGEDDPDTNSHECPVVQDISIEVNNISVPWLWKVETQPFQWEVLYGTLGRDFDYASLNTFIDKRVEEYLETLEREPDDPDDWNLD